MRRVRGKRRRGEGRRGGVEKVGGGEGGKEEGGRKRFFSSRAPTPLVSSAQPPRPSSSEKSCSL